MITILDSNLNFMMTKFNDQITLIKKKNKSNQISTVYVYIGRKLLLIIN